MDIDEESSEFETDEDFDDLDGAGMSRAANTAKTVASAVSPRVDFTKPSPAYPFQSSNANAKLAKTEYSNSCAEKYVATALGDVLPRMRDELIERKHNGEGKVKRHLRAWWNLSNWQVDPSHLVTMKSDPLRYGEDGVDSSYNVQYSVFERKILLVLIILCGLAIAGMYYFTYL